MRPHLRSPFEIAHLLDEVQSLLMQYDRNAYNQRQELPQAAVTGATNGGRRNRTAVQVEELTMTAPNPSSTEPHQPAAPPAEEFVPAGRLSGSARAERLAQIRTQIAAGTYDNEERFEKALDRLLERIEG